MAPKELEDTLVMCGQASTSTIKDLPDWFQDCMVKHTTDQYRQTIIRKWVTNNNFYDDAEIPPNRTPNQNDPKEGIRR